MPLLLWHRQEQGVADPCSFRNLYGKKHFPPWVQHRVYQSRCCLICWEGQKGVVWTIAQFCFALPLSSVVILAHLPLPPVKELCACLVKVSLSANPMHCRTSWAKATPCGSSCLLQQRMKWLMSPQPIFSPQDPQERHSWINTPCYCSLLGWESNCR